MGMCDDPTVFQLVDMKKQHPVCYNTDNECQAKVTENGEYVSKLIQDSLAK
jgi:hypothetical protein